MFTFLPTKHLPRSVLFAFKSSLVRGIQITEHDETYGKKEIGFPVEIYKLSGDSWSKNFRMLGPAKIPIDGKADDLV